MKLSAFSASVVLIAIASGVLAKPAIAEVTPIVILSAVFGPAAAVAPIDFTQTLARTCGASANYCQAFCSRAAVGRRPPRPLFFSPRSVCRVTYRCGPLLTKVTEANENDTFDLSCRPRL